MLASEVNVVVGFSKATLSYGCSVYLRTLLAVGDLPLNWN
jgi:hypothetical protein